MRTKLLQSLLCPLLAAGLLFTPVAGAGHASAAAASSAVELASTAVKSAITVYVDGEKLALSSSPYVKDGITLVPMREIFNSLSATVTWEEKTQTIIGRKDSITITLAIGKKEAVINGKSVKLDTAPVVRGGVTFVPARFIAESLGATVKWDSKTQSVRIQSKEAKLEEIYNEIEQEQNNGTKLTAAQIVEMYDESVVLISTNEALGSGVVIDDRYILTNYHVIQDATSATITTVYGDELKVTGVVKYNENSDLAIIQTEQSIGVPPVEVSLGISVQKGDKVVAIGSPLGLQNTVSDGLVSNILYEGGIRYIQTSAPIDHGSSGGALFNEYGELIGITSSGITSQADLNFAVSTMHAALLISMLPDVPSDDVAFLEPSLPDTLVGVSNEEISKLMKEHFGSVQTSEGTVKFTDWAVTRDSQGWLVFTANIDPVFYTYYGGSVANELRVWSINLGYDLHRMLPNERIQFIVSFDRIFGFEPRGFKAGEVTALGNEKWQVRFSVIDMQLKDQLYIEVRD